MVVLHSFAKVFRHALMAKIGVLVWLCIAPASFAEIIPPKNYAVTPGGINVADGSLAYSVTDLSIGSMKLERFYRTSRQQPNDPPFGTNFSSNFDIYITAAPKPVNGPRYPIVHIGSKASGVFSHSPPSTSVFTFNLDAQRGILSYTGTQYVYVDGSDASGTVYTFSATVEASGMPYAANSRKIERIDFPDGRRQTFSYSGSNLKLVEDTAGYAMVFDYDANGDVTAACAFNRSQTYVSASSTCAGAVLKTTYGYTVTLSKPYLTSATNPLSQVTNYSNGNWGMTCVLPPGFANCTIANSNHADRIATQTLQDGGSWSTVGMSPDVLNNPDAGYDGDCTNETSITDPHSVTLYLTFTKTSPCSMTDALGNTTSFVYEGAKLNNDVSGVNTDGTFLKEAVFPEGNKYQATYNGPFKSVTTETMVPKPGSGLTNLVKQYGYGSCAGPTGSYQNCAKPIWIKDPKLNQTDFTYATHGGVLSEMKPAPTSGASRPLSLYSYVQKYAYIKNSGGSLVPAATPTWVLSSETQCQTAISTPNTATCDSGGLQVTRSYQYGADGTADNLLVRGITVTADGQSRRTCFGYDPYSRRISETKPNASLSVCP
jgi:hypothetical protein